MGDIRRMVDHRLLHQRPDVGVRVPTRRTATCRFRNVALLNLQDRNVALLNFPGSTGEAGVDVA
jgi:hypothetical protein